MPVMRKIWKYLRNPTPEERQWLAILEGEKRASRMIIEYNEHRHEIENKIRQEAGSIETAKKLQTMKRDTINEINRSLFFSQISIDFFLAQWYVVKFIECHNCRQILASCSIS
jgi:hypothetical protein